MLDFACTGLSYTVPSGKLLLVTDLVTSAPTRVIFESDSRGQLFAINHVESPAFSLVTPLVIYPGERLCLRSPASGIDAMLTGLLVDAP